MLLWLTTAALAAPSSVRALVELSHEPPRLIDAWPGGAARGLTVDAGGVLEVLDRDGQRLDAVRLVDPRRRSILFPEGGGAGGTLPRAVALVDLPWPEGADRVALGGATLVPAPRRAAPGAAVAVHDSGPSSGRLDLVVLADGYTADELDRYVADVDQLVAHLLTVEPYQTYADLFNVWRVDVVSAESGVSHLDGTGIARDTALSCYYGCLNTSRLVCCDDEAVMRLATEAVPGVDGVLVLVNDPQYGGSGGFNYAVSYNGPAEGLEVATHELGHTLVGLWDEYGYGYDDDGSGPNCSEDTRGHWDEWVGTDGVDAWQECSFTSLYRPTDNGCMMRTLRDSYCPVCRQESIYGLYARLDSMVASTSFPVATEIDARRESAVLSAELVEPTTGLWVEWVIDGEVVSTDRDLELCGSGLDGDLYLHLVDDTPWVRTDPYGLTEHWEGPWQVRSGRRCPSRLACGCSAASWRGVGATWLLLLFIAGLRRRPAARRDP